VLSNPCQHHVRKFPDSEDSAEPNPKRAKVERNIETQVISECFSHQFGDEAVQVLDTNRIEIHVDGSSVTIDLQTNVPLVIVSMFILIIVLK
jgi:hypothetical protein